MRSIFLLGKHQVGKSFIYDLLTEEKVRQQNVYRSSSEIRVQEVEDTNFEVWDTIGGEQFFGAFYEKPHINCYVVNADNANNVIS